MDTEENNYSSSSDSSEKHAWPVTSTPHQGKCVNTSGRDLEVTHSSLECGFTREKTKILIDQVFDHAYPPRKDHCNFFLILMNDRQDYYFLQCLQNYRFRNSCE